ncbi:MAG: hypothetical protein ACRD03_15630 [Acidimicrobiales bacterium]
MALDTMPDSRPLSCWTAIAAAAAAPATSRWPGSKRATSTPMVAALRAEVTTLATRERRIRVRTSSRRRCTRRS